MTMKSILMCLSLLALAGTAAARDANPMAQACKADHAKFCKSTPPGGGRIVDCLKSHEAELAPACKSALDTASACGPEVRKICGDAKGSAVRDCVKAHASEFSEACRATLANR
ncbi:cysteine rich repeat-containing protein [Rhizobacter sp. SG703]|uniref:cysteine rich repeat-containing protein n=1 Tax=Rhizobacter sp. SG703 TaxID=2587140 RepID=UPI00144760F9|nr:cysteine rich repeat-containing protein [Rhizobacter sp. SG703]NKI95171.1 hypothetical protein [Rhizobacter sp. SG703]